MPPAPGQNPSPTTPPLPPNKPRPREHLALYPGSFDPITYGHLDVVRRGRHLFDRIVIAVGRNPGKDPLFSVDERLGMVRTLIQEMVAAEPAAAPVTVESFSGLTVDFANQIGATALLRGIRNLSDLQNEIQQALTNREVAGLETVFIVAGQDFAYTSSSLIRQVTAMGKDLNALASMVPALVIDKLREKKAEHHPALERLVTKEIEG
jgi:pantetheine-phosphate adenylyltransferase